MNSLLAFLLLSTSDWVVSNNFGFIHIFNNLPLVFEVFISVLLLDFISAFLAHYIEHKFNPLWMIHLVNHSDHNVDITTGNRHHPLDREKIIYGIDIFPDEQKNSNIKVLLKQPFQKYQRPTKSGEL